MDKFPLSDAVFQKPAPTNFRTVAEANWLIRLAPSILRWSGAKRATHDYLWSASHTLKKLRKAAFIYGYPLKIYKVLIEVLLIKRDPATCQFRTIWQCPLIAHAFQQGTLHLPSHTYQPPLHFRSPAQIHSSVPQCSGLATGYSAVINVTWRRAHVLPYLEVLSGWRNRLRSDTVG